MAKPPALEVLKKGKFLCSKNFPTFPDTFNYVVNRSENLKGDGDLDPKRGRIKIDNTNPEFPVIRYNENAGENNEKKNWTLLEPCELDLEAGVVRNVYFICEELLYGNGATSNFDKANLNEGAVIFLKATSYSDAVSAGCASDITAYQTSAGDTSYHWLPLYLILDVDEIPDTGEKNYKVLDLRRLPHAQSWIMNQTT